jgi:hypothetical protein
MSSLILIHLPLITFLSLFGTHSLLCHLLRLLTNYQSTSHYIHAAYDKSSLYSILRI